MDVCGGETKWESVWICFIICAYVKKATLLHMHSKETKQSSQLALDIYFSCHFKSLHLTWEFSNDTSKDYIQYYKSSAIIKEIKCTHFVISVAYVFFFWKV